MSLFVVRSRVREESVPAVEAGIDKMISAITHEAPEGVRYAYCKLPDGVTFLALLELAEGAENPLPGIAACREFQENLRNHWIDQPQAPAPEPLEVVGSYGLFK
ncbi:hypothetical protein AB0B45_31965 [Nonomuraea sp. NPDC049152]|uniref:hypothetical protein n=1 Tax=Nonomuraea sp. NPDC049152 TaxID=3154350 RepID=UPI00340E80AB